MEGGEFGCQTSSLRFSCRPCFCVHLGSLLVLPEPQFPHLQDVDQSPHFAHWAWGRMRWDPWVKARGWHPRSAGFLSTTKGPVGTPALRIWLWLPYHSRVSGMVPQ